jgi:long-chain acyl-CoA synthetase
VQSFSVPALAEIPASASLADIVVTRAERRPDEVMLRRRTGPGQWQDVTAAAFRADVEALAAGLVAGRGAPRRPGGPGWSPATGSG